MMGVIRYKIWQDLWSNKTRTLQVVLIIAVGAFAIVASPDGSGAEPGTPRDQGDGRR